MLKYLLILFGLILVAGIVLRLMVPSLSKMPTDLGVNNEQLAPCPDKPNCVSSFAADDGHAIDAIAFSGSVTNAHVDLLAALTSLPNVTIETEEPNYVHATTRSRLMGYVDDNEFLIDEQAGLIHVRAAARLGQSDMGANRARVETIRGMVQ